MESKSPTPFLQTPHGCLPESSLWNLLTRHCMTFVLPAFNLRLFASIPFFHSLNFSIFNTLILPSKLCWQNGIICIEQFHRQWTENIFLMYPTLTLKALLSLSFNLTFVVASLHIAFITDTIHSSTPRYLSAHQTTSLGTLSNAFSKSTKVIRSSLFLFQIYLLQLTDYEKSICRAPTCHKSKLHAINFYNLSHSRFNHSF